MELITDTKRAAELKGTTQTTIAHWCRMGWLKQAVKAGGSWIINSQELMDFQPPRTGPARSMESVQASIDETTRAIAEQGPDAWAGWMVYILEKLDGEATPAEFDKVLFALQDALTTRMDQGEW